MDNTLLCSILNIAFLLLLYYWLRKGRQSRSTPDKAVADDSFRLRKSPNLADAAISRVFADLDQTRVRLVFDRFDFLFDESGSYALQPATTVVEELVRRVFPPEAHLDVLTKLNEYGRKKHEAEPGRVRVDIVKASGGDPGRVAALVTQAKSDFRDVVVLAENRTYFAAFHKDTSILKNVAKGRELQDADLREFVMWLLNYV